MKEALALQPQEIQIPTFFKPREGLGQKALTTLGIVAAIGLITACQDGQAQNPNLNKPPATSAAKAPEQLIISTIVPTETPKPKVISLESYLEIDPANPSVETIKLLFPEEIIHGKSPLIPKGDTLSVSLKLKNDTRINQLSLSLSDLLNTKNDFSMGMSAVNERDTANIASAIGIFQRIAEFKISDTDQKIINKILFSTVRDSNNDLVIKLSLPNDSITIIDNDGSHLVNPAERFATGKVGIGIKRGIGSKFDLTVENSKITNNKDELVATAERFDINLSRIKVVSNTAQPNRIIPTVTPRPTPTPTPTNTPEPTRTPIPTTTPKPTPSPEPTPIPPSTPAEKKDIVLYPGKQKVWDVEIFNPFNEDRERSIDLGFLVSKEHDSLGLTNAEKTFITRIDLQDPIESVSENSRFTVKAGKKRTGKIIVNAPPGTSPGCFREVNYVVKGTNGVEIEPAVPLTQKGQKVCAKETFEAHFTSLFYNPNPEKKLLIGKIQVRHTANVGQMIQLVIACGSFEIAEKGASKESQIVSLDDYIPILPNTDEIYDVFLKPKVNNTGLPPPYPYNCIVTPKRDFGKEIPLEPK